jgi:hypothetical protein
MCTFGRLCALGWFPAGHVEISTSIWMVNLVQNEEWSKSVDLYFGIYVCRF